VRRDAAAGYRLPATYDATVADSPGSSGERRADLFEALERRALTRDDARPDGVERRHAAGGRTTRENVADLVDPGSFVEYGALAIAARTARRELRELGFRRELDAIPDEDERERRVQELTAAAHERAKALNAATLFELDDVIDPAETRRLIASTIAAAAPPASEPRPDRFIDAW
jgi:acetyl-CoA carboxylase carboxyltransferase component